NNYSEHFYQHTKINATSDCQTQTTKHQILSKWSKITDLEIRRKIQIQSLNPNGTGLETEPKRSSCC
ncbi:MULTISPECIES: hypothetical protein, partial [unclassified Rhizobium]|uniref:hypothetical protein n=1 Tax=unclassified Rhizobium TaxID=2613769 RepID=UPI00193CC973